MSGTLTFRLFVALIWAVAAVVPAAFAQESPLSYPANPRFSVQRLEDQFGLGAVTVTNMVQDEQGFLWIGTQTGLYRYDGARARKMPEVESIIGHYVLDMLIAPDGTPWFAGNNGIACFKGDHFEALPVPASAMPLASGNQIFAVDGKGAVFALLFRPAMLRVDPAHPSQAAIISLHADTSQSATSIVRGADDTIWFTAGSRLGRIAPGSSSAELDPLIRLPDDRIVGMIFDRAQTLWLRTASRLARLDPGLHKLTLETARIGIANEEEGRPSLDRQGNLLVPSSLGLYWNQNGHWRVLTDKQGLSSNDIQYAFEDREGTLWIGGSGTGLDRLPGIHEWSAWTTAEGLPDNSTWTTLRDRNGRLWVSTSRGIGIWDGRSRQWRRIALTGEHAHAEVRQIRLAGDGSVWALTATGAVARINPTNFSVTLLASYHGRPFRQIVDAPDGKVWGTTGERLVRFDFPGAVDRLTEIPLPTGESRGIGYMAFSPGGALWGTGRAGLHRFAENTWRTLTTADGLQGQRITSIAALNDNEAWVAYNDVMQVTHIVLSTDGKSQMDHHNWDFSIVGFDSRHRVWMNGTDGVAILSPDGRMQRINHADGLIWDDLSPWSSVREESDGSFMIATSRGLACYRPGNNVAGADSPNVVITAISLGNAKPRATDAPRVQASDGSLTVEFTPLILDNPARASCRYQLKGLEKQPTETMLREVRYSALPPGSYEFWVQCQHENSGLASAKQAQFRFTVLPPVWQTWWARMAGALVLLLAFGAFVSLRTRALQRRRRDLEHAVAQRSAELVQKNKELEEISLTDPLTLTRNRRYFYETIPTDVARALRSHLKTADPEGREVQGQELILLLLDIDRFKHVNDELGHAAGDRLLQEVAKRIGSVMRRSDDLVRWGGEEFLLVCRTTDRQNASLLCQRVLDAIRDIPFDVGNGVQIHKTCSIGWAPFPWLPEDVGLLSIENVIELADKALYLAKREGRNRGFGMLPAPDVLRSEKSVSIKNLRDCPPDLVQIV
ncbi:MAG TPA: diguanylate cyclase [Candidatus Acidoferrum sp.]